jgi:predicted negative regulator of RcsB-dependent stress response
MARHPSARRLPREQGDPDDVFVTRVLEATAWAKANARALVIGGAALLVLVVGALWYVQSQRTLREQASAQINEVRQSVLSGNRMLAIRDLETFLNRFGGAPAANEARLMLGQLYLEEGRVQEAKDAVSRLARSPGDAMGAPAAFLLAAAHEAANEPQDAEQVYLRIGERGRFDYQRREALDHAAQIRVRQGNPAGAAELYERLIAMTPEELPERSVFEMRLAEVRAMALTAR